MFILDHQETGHGHGDITKAGVGLVFIGPKALSVERVLQSDFGKIAAY
jgi:hypothetical protein